MLVAVLWILGALAAFAGVFSGWLSSTAAGAAVREETLAARGLATAAVELAALRLVSEPRERRPTHGALAFRMGRAEVTATFRDEAARIDLNAAPGELLAGLFGALGASEQAAREQAERILAFRSPASGPAEAREADLYRQSGLGYTPRGGAFVHVEEIWRVTGLPPALVARALPHLTVFSGRAEVNVDEADPVVQAAARAAAPTVEGGAPPPRLAVPAGDAQRIAVRIRFDSGRSQAAEAVILLRDFGDAPYRVLSWREGADFALPPPSEAPTRGGRP
ncbi:type II secretion system protein GspK [Xanthobacter sp. V3C-3]|uniref:general secretion pathway protein GspK n=1 Tax=Xanthobacter lutulentifluminis TaxID=3119935 RepID=UPI00372BA9F2